jgi:hypothetical protein
MIAASNIHGTGAQNLANAKRHGWIAVSGIAFGPYFASNVLASSLVNPCDRLPSPLFCDGVVLLDALAAAGSWLVIVIDSSSPIVDRFAMARMFNVAHFKAKR